MTGRGRELLFDLSGIVVRFHGLDDELVAAFREHWAPFLAGASAGPPWLDIGVASSDRPVVVLPAMRPSLVGEVRADGARFRSDEGSIEVDAQGRASAAIGSGDAAWRFWGLVNLAAAVVAYRMPSRPGAVLHAAGVVIAGRAFVLVGPSGTGKSTWARAAREAGARVVSDDTVVLDAASGVVELLGTPIRAHEAHPGGAGRWPVAAILHARWGAPPSLAPIARLAVHARLAANLLFLGSAWGRDARLAALADLLADSVPHRELTFSPDPSFVEVLRAAL